MFFINLNLIYIFPLLPNHSHLFQIKTLTSISANKKVCPSVIQQQTKHLSNTWFIIGLSKKTPFSWSRGTEAFLTNLDVV